MTIYIYRPVGSPGSRHCRRSLARSSSTSTAARSSITSRDSTSRTSQGSSAGGACQASRADRGVRYGGTTEYLVRRQGVAGQLKPRDLGNLHEQVLTVVQGVVLALG